MDTSTRRLLLAIHRSGCLLSYAAAGRLGPGPTKALSEALAAGHVERTGSGYALNAYGRTALDAKPAKEGA